MKRERRKYSNEFKHELVRTAIDSRDPISATARAHGVNSQTLANWVKAYRDANPEQDEPLSVSDRARLRELERENRELRMKNEFLGKAAAFFAREHP